MDRGKIILLILLICLVAAKCANAPNQGSKIEQENREIAESYRPIYENALKENSLNELATIVEIIKTLGAAGYVAVDYYNEIDMVNSGQVEEFCKTAKLGKEAKQTLFLVQNDGGFVRYDLKAVNREIKVSCSTVNFEDGKPVFDEGYEFVSYVWQYSDKGYFFLEEYRPKDLDGVPMNTAIRVSPLDEKCREYNRKYLEPIGYNANNIFITDWSETDYGELEFYDLYEPMYRIRWKEEDFVNQLQEGITYEFPEDQFEEVFRTYFAIDRQILQSQTLYNEENHTYQYRTRGMGDYSPTSTPPYPEVTGYRQNEDGTLTLTVEAVWPEMNLDCAFSHELTVRPQEGGRFQYVSNRVTGYAEEVESAWDSYMSQYMTLAEEFHPLWYRERFSEQEWIEFYGGESE